MPVALSNYGQALVWLDQLASERKFFRVKRTPSLETTNKLLEALGRPDTSFEYRVVIGGTAGKGTTCRYIEQTLLNEGKAVALLSSPHLQVINERIRLNGQLVSRTKFARGILHIKNICETSQLEPTFYEVIVVAGIYLAAQAKVEILICEVGIGGEFDAINAVQGPRIAALTFIGTDHLEMFDGKIENLAIAKAGIFTKDSVLNLTYEQKYRSILNSTNSSKIVYLKGIKDKMNKKIARNLCEKILSTSDFQMQTPRLPARWEKVSDNMILDGAHSAPRFEYILSKIKKYKPTTGVFAMSPNHDPESFSIILEAFKHIIWTEFSGSQSAAKLQALHGIGEVEPDLDKALTQATGKALATGSLYLCGHAREHFYKSQDILDEQTEWPKKIKKTKL